MRHGCRVLSIERDPRVRTALMELVPANHYQLIQTCEVQSGLDALEWVGACVVLLDPGLASDELVQRLVSLPEPPLLVLVDRIIDYDELRLTCRLNAQAHLFDLVGEGLAALLDQAHSYLACDAALQQ